MSVDRQLGATFAEMLEALAQVHDIAPQFRVQFQARLRKLQQAGVTPNPGEGRGKTALYDVGAIVQMAIALELTQAGLDPAEIKPLMDDEEYGIFMSVLMASRALSLHSENWGDGGQDDPALRSIFLYVDASAMSHLMQPLPDGQDRASASFFYGGVGVIKDNILNWTTGAMRRLTLINVSSTLLRLQQCLPGRLQASFLEHVNAWADERLHEGDFDLEGWVASAKEHGLFTPLPIAEHVQSAVDFTSLVSGFNQQQIIIPDQKDGELVPDGILVMPGQREILIDAKVPLEAALQFLESTDPTKASTLRENVLESLRDHIKGLTEHPYKTRFSDKSNFTIAFVPFTWMVDALLKADPAFLDWAYERRVLVSSPLEFVSIVKVAQSAWQSERAADAAQEVIRFAHSKSATLDRLGELANLAKETTNGDR